MHRIFALLLALPALFGCGPHVIDDLAAGGGGASASTPAAAGGGGGGGGEGGAGREHTCAAASADGSCFCARREHAEDLSVRCAPSNGKLMCICTYNVVFSGICYETEPGEACSIDGGCCEAYFSGH